MWITLKRQENIKLFVVQKEVVFLSFVENIKKIIHITNPPYIFYILRL